MSYTIASWCASCGKAKTVQYVATRTDTVTPTPDETMPELCVCANSIEIRPSTSPIWSFEDAHRKSHLTSECMQKLEQMVRRVVAEEISRFLDHKQLSEQEHG